MKRVVIDVQSLQTSSAKRGIGRYTREIVRALLQSSQNELDIYLVMNGRLNCEQVLKDFDGYIARDHIKTWTYYPNTPAGINQDLTTPHGADFFYEWFLHQLNADIIWIPNILEDRGLENLCISIKLTSGREHIVTTLHDVTPLLYQDEYFKDKTYKNWYLNKLEQVKKCDLIFTDSVYSKQTIVKLLNIRDSKVIVHSLGYNEKFFNVDNIIKTFEYKKPFFLNLATEDYNKNIEGLINAYSALPQKIRDNYQLILAGPKSTAAQEKYKKIALERNLDAHSIEVITHVNDLELKKLMQNCAAFVFPSFAEGFGLPALEAMACGAPTIVANNTSLPEIVNNPEATFDPYDIEEISSKMLRVVTDEKFANSLIENGLNNVRRFSWNKGAEQIKSTILDLTTRKTSTSYDQKLLCKDLAKTCDSYNYNIKAEMAKSVDHSTIVNHKPKIFVDVSLIVHQDFVSGIQRVINGLINGLKLVYQKYGFTNVEVIYSSEVLNEYYTAKNNGYKYVARPENETKYQVSFHDGDIFILADLNPGHTLPREKFLKGLSVKGVKVISVVYDILPVKLPQYFFGDQAKLEFENWLKEITKFSGIMCISQTGLSDFTQWCQDKKINFAPFCKLDYFYLGADIQSAQPTTGIPKNEKILGLAKYVPTLLMVSTIEPRKGHADILNAMECLWNKKVNMNLVFVGRPGWKMEKFIERIEAHHELNKHFFWTNHVSDEYLNKLYECSIGVIMASMAEGFGLPIIEAAQHKKPVLVRDIPIFREVAGDHAVYFSESDSQALSETIQKWVNDVQKGVAPDSSQIKYLTWEESADQFLKKVMTE